MQWQNRSMLVLVKTYPGKAEEVYTKVQADQRTLAAYVVTGTWDVMCWVDTRNMTDVYNYVQQLRSWSQVERTSSCPTYDGYWNETPVQNDRTYVWLKARGNGTKSPHDYLCKTDGVAYAYSTPGDYDCYALYGYDNVQNCYDLVSQMRAQGYEVECTNTVQSYRNARCDQQCTEYEKTAYQTNR